MIKVYNENRTKFPFEQKTEGSSGYDLTNTRADRGDSPIVINPHERWIIPTGIYLSMPRGIEAQIRHRSSMMVNHGVGPMLSTIDSDYRGELKITLVNLSTQPYTLRYGDRVAQLVFAPVLPQFLYLLDDLEERATNFKMWREVMRVELVDNRETLGTTARGEGGHGSTGT